MKTKTKTKKTKVQWFARCGGIARMGPFSSHLEAAWALMTIDGTPAPGAFIWPETPGRRIHQSAPPKNDAAVRAFEALSGRVSSKSRK